MSAHKIGETIVVSFGTEDSTGAGADADSLPTAILKRAGSDTGAAVTVSAATGTGAYTASVTVPAGGSDGDTLEIVVTATVGGVTSAPTPVWSGQQVGERVADLNDLDSAAAQSAAAAALTAYNPPTKAEMDAALANVAIYAAGSAPDGDPDWSIRRGDRVVLTIACSLVSPNADREALWFTVKRDRDHADSAALLMVTEGDGLTVLGGSATLPSGVEATDVQITAVDEGASTVQITLLPPATALLSPRGQLEWDVQQLRPSENVQTLEAGSNGAFISDVTRSVS